MKIEPSTRRRKKEEKGEWRRGEDEKMGEEKGEEQKIESAYNEVRVGHKGSRRNRASC